MKLGIILAAGLICALLLITPEAKAHGGRTDSSGCHKVRATGDRHCHNAGSGNASISKSKKKRKKRRK